MAAYSPMLARRRLMKRWVQAIPSVRTDGILLACTVSFQLPLVPIVHTTGTNQCFLMNYIGSVCETDASSPVPTMLEIVCE